MEQGSVVCRTEFTRTVRRVSQGGVGDYITGKTGPRTSRPPPSTPDPSQLSDRRTYDEGVCVLVDPGSVEKLFV